LVLGFLHAGFLLVFLPAPAALGEGFGPSVLHDGLPLAVVGLLRGDEVDARPLNEFRGEDDVWLRKGHIPGAISFHWARLMEKDNTHKFKPFNQTKPALEAAGITPDKDIICYCGTSREGSLLFFYLKHVAGFPKVRLYEGAWKEYVWLHGKSLPAETGGQPAGIP
jgi:3-mercaptopyruvate sulfurtransferase SseA